VNELQKGLWYGLAAYASWGVFPLYWKMLGDVPVLQVIAHRVLWSSVLLTAWVAVSGQLGALAESTRIRGVLGTYAVAALLIGVNWILFVWAVASGFVVETSLGYFVNPLLSVLLGVFVLGETLRSAQWAAVALAASGVAYITIAAGRLPWISLMLATTFACYGLVKKRAPLGSVHGLTIETGLLVLPALGYLAWSETTGSAAFLHERLVGFSLVWAALALFAVDGVLAHRTSVVEPPPE
jgi:chloramphenicol-sensitive protein RarD